MSIAVLIQVFVLVLVGAGIMWAKNADEKRKNEQASKDKKGIVDIIFWIVGAFLAVGIFLGFVGGWK
jgi:heme/copper-type cytochrome/quinol oxidase subunit 1